MNRAASIRKTRCAVYTRESSEEGLDGRQLEGLTVAALLRGVTPSWEEQRRFWDTVS
jgi:hypothetical protein